METKYYKKEYKDEVHGGAMYKAVNSEIDLTFFTWGTMNVYPGGDIYDYDEDYKEITREEFMEAYIPVNEKINAKIAEL